MPSLITLRIGCLKVGQASINATVRHWGNPALPVQLSDWKELGVTITEGACPIAQTKRHHRAKLCRPSSVTLLENSGPRHGHEKRAHFARRDHHARAKPA